MERCRGGDRGQGNRSSTIIYRGKTLMFRHLDNYCKCPFFGYPKMFAVIALKFQLRGLFNAPLGAV